MYFDFETPLVSMLHYRYQSNGPQVDDIATDVAMDRLGKFSEKFREYSERQSTMNAVEGLYSLEITKPSELGVIGYVRDVWQYNSSLGVDLAG